MKMQKQEQKPKKTLDELIQELKSITKKMAVVYVPQIADAVEYEHPDWDIYKKRDFVSKSFVDNGWNEQYIDRVIREHAPQLNEGNVFHHAQITRWKNQKNDEKLKASIDNFNKQTKNMEPPEVKEREPEPMSDEELTDLGVASYGGREKSIFDIKNEIWKGARILFSALCDEKEAPYTAEEDLLVDYIKPTREYRLTLAYELDKSQRANIHNLLHSVIEASEDMIDQIDKADKK